MRGCEDYALHLSLLIDNELDGDDRKNVEDHLNRCDACRDVFNRQRWFLSSIRKTLPSDRASDYLRERVEAAISEPRESIQNAQAPASSDLVSESARKFMHSYWARLGAIAAIAACVAVLSLTIIQSTLQERAANISENTTDFAAKAADSHRRHSVGQLPLELKTRNSAEVSAWFDGKVPFRVKLPDYQHVFGEKVLFELDGARLVGFNNEYAAYIAYQMEEDPVSLVVTSSNVAFPTGAKTITAKSIDFHYNNIAGLQVISWSHRGLTYALVSDFDTANSQQSCIVCHIGADDPDFKASFIL